MMQQNNSLAVIMAKFDSRSITVHPLSTIDAPAIFFFKKKPIKTLSICGHLPKSILHFFPQKNKRVQKVPTYVPIVFVINYVWQNGNPLIKYGGVIRFRHVLSFFLFFFYKKLDLEFGVCQSFVAVKCLLSPIVFRKKKTARVYCRRHFDPILHSTHAVM